MTIIYKNVEDLIPYVNNTRTHSKEQVNQIASSIKEFGFTNPVLIDEQGGIIAGHGRIMGAKLLKMDEVPTICLDGLSEAQKKAYIIADNKLALNAGWDEELLKLEIEALQDMDFNIDLLGFSDEELADLEIGLEDLPELDTDKADEVPELEENPVIKLGDLIELGHNYQHRLLCGDSTSEDDVKRLMDGKKADMVFTDPPYGVAIDNANGKIKGDEDLFVFNECIPLLRIHSKEDAHIYIYFGVQFIVECMGEIKKHFKQTNLLVQRITHENKPSPKGYFKGNYELCFFSNPKLKHFNGGLIEVSESTKNDSRYNGTGFLEEYKALNEIKATEHNARAIHPTQKTTEITDFYINISSKQKDIILDLFGGSGTTMISSENLSRHSRLMELDEKYAQVIIQRYVDYTSNPKIKINGVEVDWEDYKASAKND